MRAVSPFHQNDGLSRVKPRNWLLFFLYFFLRGALAVGALASHRVYRPQFFNRVVRWSHSTTGWTRRVKIVRVVILIAEFVSK